MFVDFRPRSCMLIARTSTSNCPQTDGNRHIIRAVKVSRRIEIFECDTIMCGQRFKGIKYIFKGKKRL